MDNQIDLTIPVKQVIDAHPEIVDILVDLGFSPLANPAMRNTVGKIVSLEKGCKMINLPIEKLITELNWNGYTIKRGEEND